MKKLFPLMAVLLVSGCTTPYVEPEGADTASLSIQNMNAVGSVNTLAFKVAKDCSGGKQTLPNGNYIGLNQKTTFRVKADEDFSFSVHYLGGGRYCHMPATFHPQAGRDYVARFMVDNSFCYLLVWVNRPAGTFREPSFKLRKWQTPMWGDGSFCTD